MKKTFYILPLIIAFFSLNAQAQSPLISQYFLNNYTFNPAFAGVDNRLEALAAYRQDFIGFQDAPVSQVLTFEMPFQEQKFGIGAYLHNHTIGPQRNTGLQLSYAYHMRMPDETSISFGLGANLWNRSIDFTRLADNGGDLNDPALIGQQSAATSVDGSAGINFQNRSFFTSFSVMNIAETANRFGDDVTPFQDNARHFYWMTGFEIPLQDSVLDLEPSLLIKYSEGNSPQADLNARFVYRDFLWFMLAYRAGNTIVGGAGIRIMDQVDVGYSYDHHTSLLQQFGGASHEITIRYVRDYNKPRIPKDSLLVDEILDSEVDSTAILDSIARADSIALADSLEMARMDSISKAKQDSLARIENAEKDSAEIARLDSLVRVKEDSIAQAKKDSLEQARKDSIAKANEKPVDTTSVVEKPKTKKIDDVEVDVYDDTNPYKYVIAGSFGNFSNALNFRDAMKEKGYDAEIIEHTARGFYRVSLYKSLDSTDAGDHMMEYRKKLGNPNIWVLENASYQENLKKLQQKEAEIKEKAKDSDVEYKEVEGDKVEVLNKDNKYYHLIGGSFGNINNAKALQNEFKSKGYDAQILYDEDRKLYRVGLFKSLDAGEARTKLKELQDSLNPAIWILKK